MALRADEAFDIPDADEMGEIIEHALDAVDAPEQDEAHGFRVENEGQADWVSRQLARVRARQAEVSATAHRQIEAVLASVQPWIDPIKEWQESETERLAREAEHWEALLLLFHRSVLAEDPKAKTIRLPHATLSARKLPDHWEFTEDKFLDWARTERPELVRTVESIDKPLVKKTVDLAAAGQVPGVTVTVGEVRFSVETEQS